MAKVKRASDGEHDHTDGCLCGFDLEQNEVVGDANLPVSKGGVEKRQKKSTRLEKGKGAFDDIDGCDLDFNEDDPTEDKDLPASLGGVA